MTTQERSGAFLDRVGYDPARIDRSLVLLAQDARSISEIAYQVGYQNYRDFYRNFVKQENASPRQVRARLRRPRADGAADLS